MAIPIISEILNVMRTAVTVSFQGLGHIISSAPPMLKPVIFLFLISFASGLILNYSIGVYYVCDEGSLYQPNSIGKTITIKYEQYKAEEGLFYCTGEIEDELCVDYTNEYQCNIVCHGAYGSVINDTCIREEGTLEFFFGFLDLSSASLFVNRTCEEFTETECRVIDGCKFITSKSETPFAETLKTDATKQKIDPNSLHLGCGGKDGSDISLFAGGLNLLSYETALALVLLTLMISMIGMFKK